MALAMLGAFHFLLTDDLTFTGCLAAVVTISALLAAVVAMGVAVGSVSNSTVVGITALWIALYGSGLLMTLLPSTYPTPEKVLSRLPHVLQGQYDLSGLADWVLVQDLGFLGGLGTDPNSMLPVALLAVAGYVALARRPVAEVATEAATDTAALTADPAAGAAGVRARLVHAVSTSSLRAIVAVWAVAVVLLGAGPMALAQANSTADPVIARAIDGNAAPLNFAAPLLRKWSRRQEVSD